MTRERSPQVARPGETRPVDSADATAHPDRGPARPSIIVAAAISPGRRSPPQLTERSLSALRPPGRVDALELQERGGPPPRCRSPGLTFAIPAALAPGRAQRHGPAVLQVKHACRKDTDCVTVLARSRPCPRAMNRVPLAMDCEPPPGGEPSAPTSPTPTFPFRGSVTPHGYGVFVA